jgi:hypothetical protein
MRLVLEHVQRLPGAMEFYTSRLRGNHAAAAFYKGLGFQYTGEEADGDLLMKIDVTSIRWLSR